MKLHHVAYGLCVEDLENGTVRVQIRTPTPGQPDPAGWPIESTREVTTGDGMELAGVLVGCAELQRQRSDVLGSKTSKLPPRKRSRAR